MCRRVAAVPAVRPVALDRAEQAGAGKPSECQHEHDARRAVRQGHPGSITPGNVIFTRTLSGTASDTGPLANSTSDRAAGARPPGHLAMPAALLPLRFADGPLPSAAEPISARRMTCTGDRYHGPVTLRALLPKEHGAYGQMIMPIATSIAVAGASPLTALLTAATAAAFLAHEPLLVLLGRRGGRATRELGPAARAWLAITLAAAGASGIWAALALPPGIRWSLAVPLVPAAIFIAALLRGREKRALAEIAVAAAFAGVALPLCVASGAPARAGTTVALAFAATFITATLAVRSIILATRGGGDPAAARRLRAATMAVSCTAAGTLAAAAAAGWLPWTTLVASGPGLAAATYLALAPPPPTRLRRVGWTLVAVSVSASIILVLGL